MNVNIIVTEPSKNLRLLGRNALNGKWKMAFIASIVYLLCIQLPVMILDELFGQTFPEMLNNGAMLYYDGSFTGQMMEAMGKSTEKVSAMSGVYSFLVTGAFILGITIFFLNLFRRKEAEPAQVFMGFENFFKALGLMFMTGLFTVLWTLLFIVPGIIAALRYSQAFFILADNPEKGIMECISESKQMMKGNKAKLFCLGFSFIGWILLAGVATAFVSGIIGAIFGMGSVAAILSGIASCVIVAWIFAYIMSTEVAFYEILRGNLRASVFNPGQY